MISPPKGAWFEQLSDGFRVGATTRSPAALFVVPFITLWSLGWFSGIVAMIALQIHSGRFAPHIFLLAALFCAPLVAIGLLGWRFFFLGIAGKCVVTVKNDEAELFVGVRKTGWRRYFRWSEVQAVSEGTANRSYPGGNQSTICLEAHPRVIFGTSLNQERRAYQALRSQVKHAAKAGPVAGQEPPQSDTTPKGEKIWFAATGWPKRWQGWLLLTAYLGLVFSSVLFHMPPFSGHARTLYLGVIFIAVTIVYRSKRERARRSQFWNW